MKHKPQTGLIPAPARHTFEFQQCDFTEDMEQPEAIPVDKRLFQVPVLHVRGTHYDVGFSIGRTFKSLIEDLLKKWDFVSSVALPKYQTEEGQRLYDAALNLCERRFPGYLQEINGMAQGANISFHELFILHVDTLMTYPDPSGNKGCTSIMVNCDENVEGLMLGHTEDADNELLNNVYIVHAVVTDDKHEEELEEFTTLTYAGHLPGYTMGFNRDGVVHCINTLYPKHIYSNGSPRAFVARSLLAAKNLDDATRILKDAGVGIADGVSVNIYFPNAEDKNARMFNIEVAPGTAENNESVVDVVAVPFGTSFAHCNRYLRLQQEEMGFASSVHRHRVLANKFASTVSEDMLKKALSDQSDIQFPIFRESGQEGAVTVAVGIFKIMQKSWEIFIEQPGSSKPVARLPL